MRRFARAVGSILGMSLVFVAILLATAMALSAIFAFFGGYALVGPANLYIGLTCGLIIWLFVAVFHLNKDSLQVPVGYPEGFLDKAREVMKDLGYEVIFQTSEQIFTRPGFYSYLFGGGILIRLEGNQARVIGPKVLAELVRRRLRLQNHIDKIQQSMQEQRRRPTGRLLKRVQIAVKVEPHQIEGVRRHVIQPLMEEGSVICMLTILAQSDKGIRELTPDSPIRTWLDQEGLHADFQRDHVELSEPLQATPCGKDTLTGKEVLAALLQEAPKRVISQ